MVVSTDMTTARQIAENIIGYRQDPIGFAINILGFNPDHIWDKMVELCEAVRDHQKVCVRAGHSVSKTFSLGRIIVPWFKACFQPSTVVTTAPGDNQVRNQLWREIRASKVGARVPLGGRIHTVHWDCKPSPEVLATIDPADRPNWEKNFAIGFSTSPDSCAEHATKMQGWHNEWVLVVVDEGCGMMDQIMRTAEEGLISDDQCKIIVSGNPTDPECEMAKMCYSSDPVKQEGNEPYMSDRGYYVITIAGTDTPNYKERRRVIPGLASYEWVESIKRKYGEDGDGTRYRVKGLFPLFKEGTYFGRHLAAARRAGRITDVPHDERLKVHTFSDTGDRWTFTLFVQFVQDHINIIDEYWDNEGLGLPGWVNYLQSRPYSYGDHFAGPDIDPDQGSNAKSFQTGKTLVSVAAGLGYDLRAVIKHSFNNGIESSRNIWTKTWIDKTHCDTLLKAAGGYGKKKNLLASTESEIVYHDHPAKTWHRHPMDAWRHMAIAFDWMQIGEEYIGGRRVIADYYEEDSMAKADNYNWNGRR